MAVNKCKYSKLAEKKGLRTGQMLSQLCCCCCWSSSAARDSDGEEDCNLSAISRRLAGTNKMIASLAAKFPALETAFQLTTPSEALKTPAPAPAPVAGGRRSFATAVAASASSDVPYMTVALAYGTCASLKGQGITVSLTSQAGQSFILGTPTSSGGYQPMLISDKPPLWVTQPVLQYSGSSLPTLQQQFNVAESSALDGIAPLLPQTPSKAAPTWSLVVNLFPAGAGPTTAPVETSQALPVTLYAGAGNVLSVVVSSISNTTNGKPANNGSVSIQSYFYSGSTGKLNTLGFNGAFSWKGNVPTAGVLNSVPGATGTTGAMLPSGRVLFSTPITGATYSPSGQNMNLQLTINQAVTLTSDYMLLVYTQQGYLTPGPGQTWGAWPLDTIGMGAWSSDKSMCWGISASTAGPSGCSLAAGTHTLTLSASPNLQITSVGFGSPGAFTTGSISNAVLQNMTTGLLSFQVVGGPITLINAKNQGLLLTLKNGTCKTGDGQAWGGNIGVGFSVSNTTSPGFANSPLPVAHSNYYQYMLLPSTWKATSPFILTPANFQCQLAVQQSAKLVDLTSAASFPPPTSPPLPLLRCRHSLSRGSTRLGQDGLPPLRVGYIQLSGEQPVNATTMPSSGIASCTVIVLAFAATKSGATEYSSTPPKSPMNYYSECKYIADFVSSDAEIFYSVGGANICNTTINVNTVSDVVSKVCSQITDLKGCFKQGITGVDLDMEGGWPHKSQSIDGQTIADLIDGFKAAGYKVSLAPQLTATDGNDIDPAKPCINLGLASGLYDGNCQFNKAIQLATKSPDYIFLQCYNTGGFTLGGYGDNDPEILTAVFTAMNNLVSTKYDSQAAPMSISMAPHVQIAIGFPANGASGNDATVFYPTNPKPQLFNNAPLSDYNPGGVLSQLKSQAATLNWGAGNVQGIMVWSLNNDYKPKWFQDDFAQTGGFCSTIFGATPVPQQPQVPYMTLSLNFTHGSDITDQVILVTIITPDDQYLIFGTPDGNGGCKPMQATDSPLWVTLSMLTSAANSLAAIQAKFTMAESGALDVIASTAQGSTPANVPVEYKCKMMVSLYPGGTTDPNTAPLMQSQALSTSLYTYRDNVINVNVLNANNDEEPWGSTNQNPAANGSLQMLNVPRGGGQADHSGGAYLWSSNVPSPEGWLGKLFGDLFIALVMTAFFGDPIAGIAYVLEDQLSSVPIAKEIVEFTADSLSLYDVFSGLMFGETEPLIKSLASWTLEKVVPPDHDDDRALQVRRGRPRRF
eukprot:RCo020210